MVNSSKRKGDISEARVIAKLLEMGYDIFTPFGENTSSDIIIDDGDELKEVQIKTAWETGNGCVQFRTSRTTSNRTTTKRSNYEGEIDIFISYSGERDEFYCVNIDEATKDKFLIRYDEPDKETSQINWEEDYLLEEKL